MKKFFLSLLCLVFAFMLIFAITGCNSKTNVISDKENTTVATETTATDVSGIQTTAKVPVTTEVSAEVIPQNESTESYTREENELEIITVPDVEDIPITDSVKIPTEKPAEIFTEPQNPFTQNEPIELPFVPVN